MKTESGMQKNIGNFESLIAHCDSYLEKYNPGNTNLSVDSLNTTLAHTQEMMDREIEAKKIFQDITNFRAKEFDGIGQLSGRTINALISSGASEAKVEDANEHHRKLNGRRVDNSKPPEENNKEEDPENEEDTEKEEGPGRHSVSQLGYDNRIGHFKKLIATLRTEPLYNPNETDITLSALGEKLENMIEINKKLKNIQSAWQQSLIARNDAFNNDETGLVHIASLVKGYVKSVFLANSSQYKQLSSLRFHKI